MKPLSKERLQKLRASEIEIDRPHEDPWYQDRLQWLVDNEPEWVDQVFQENPEQLHRELVRSLQQATLSEVQYRRLRNLPDHEARELAHRQIIAPADGRSLAPDPPEPLSPARRQEILSWAEDPGID